MLTRLFSLLLSLTLTLGITAQTNRISKTQSQSVRKTTPVRKTAQPTKKVTAGKPTAAKTIQSSPRYKEVNYTLRGKAHGFQDGEWIKMCEPDRTGLTATDSVQLQGEDFTFKGKTLNVPYMKYLVVGQGAHKTLVEVFLEEGIINVDITADKRIDRVSGTVTNNIYTPYRDSINTIYTQIYECTRQNMRMSNSAEEREAYKLGADSLRRQIVTYTYSFARKNLNNWVGIYLFAEYYKRFTASQNKALLAAIPKKFAVLPLIDDIRKYTKTQK